MSAALFGNTSRATSKHLVEFKAGKMHMKGKMVHPDKRKGLAYIYQSDDMLMHFCWKDRSSGNIEEDFIIFPEDFEYKKVTQCTTGRVYVLRFKSNNRRVFFWMQEPKSETDDDTMQKVNEFLKHPPSPGSQRTNSNSTGGSNNPVLGSDLAGLQNSDLHNFIGNISQQQLMHILGSGVPSLATLLSPNSSSRLSSSSSTSNTSNSTSGSATTASTTSSATSTAAPPSITTATPTTTTGGSGSGSSVTTPSGTRSIQLSDLQNILSVISVPPTEAEKISVDLAAALTTETLQPILSNPDFVEELRPFLPAGEQMEPIAKEGTTEELKGTLTSPQFRQAVNLFTSALESGQLGPLIRQFDLGDEAVKAAANSDMEAFIKALSKNKKEDKDDDDTMAVD